MVGQKFKNKLGLEFEILEYTNAHKIKIRFIVSGCTKVAAKKEIVRGEVKDTLSPSIFGVGFIGQGNYTSKSRGYRDWLSMLRRCYSPKELDEKPSYVDKYVCKEWQNFQNFAEWFESNHIEGFELDKDLILKGNKEYSPDKCAYVPTEINSSIIKFGGVHLNKKTGKYIAQCRDQTGKRYIGSFDSYETAEVEYLTRKHSHLLMLCDKYSGIVDERVIKSLREWVYG